MNDSYLILHKVRGEPAFDIAEQTSIDGNIWWIIPTSGHRAHPFMFWPLLQVAPQDAIQTLFHIDHLPNWHNVLDHYHAARKPEQAARPTSARPTHFTADDL